MHTKYKIGRGVLGQVFGHSEIKSIVFEFFSSGYGVMKEEECNTVEEAR